MKSQFFQGLIGGATGGSNPVALLLTVSCYYIGGDYSSNHYGMYFRDADPQRIWVEETTEAGQKNYNDVKLAKNSAHNQDYLKDTNLLNLFLAYCLIFLGIGFSCLGTESYIFAFSSILVL